MIRTGTIKTLVPEQGIGFIERTGQVRDCFFHYSVLTGIAFDKLERDDLVDFDVVDSPRGPRAVSVRWIKHSLSA